MKNGKNVTCNTQKKVAGALIYGMTAVKKSE